MVQDRLSEDGDFLVREVETGPGQKKGRQIDERKWHIIRDRTYTYPRCVVHILRRSKYVHSARSGHDPLM